MNKKRILLVDDEQKITRMLTLCLKQTGRYDVEAVNLGAQALAAAKTFHPDLIILDMVMPDMDGATVSEQIQNDPKLSDTPILFLTATLSRSEVGPMGSMIHGRKFLAKPVDPDVIVKCIEDTLVGV